MNDQTIIINVGRQIGSGGGMIARMLADEFGCKLYDKELLNLQRYSGLTLEELAQDCGIVL